MMILSVLFVAITPHSAIVTPCCALQLREKYIKDEDLSDTKATYSTIRKALATLNDPFTRFLEPQQFAALRRGTAGSVTGVGLEIGFENRGGDSNRIVVRCHTSALSTGSHQSAWAWRGVLQRGQQPASFCWLYLDIDLFKRLISLDSISAASMSEGLLQWSS